MDGRGYKSSFPKIYHKLQYKQSKFRMIQPANEGHLDEIHNIEKMVFTKPWTRENIKIDLTLKTNTENWVYLKNQKVAGYIFGWKVMDEFHLNNIAVHIDFQRRYIGKNLIKHVSARLQKQDIRQIYLEVSGKNIPGQQLYESLGFQQDGMRMDYYEKGEHALLYHMDLVAND